jgi:hypothetical protein
MTPEELKSLNDLAMAHGGHITINPHTGLPEAGFLSSILPMVAGFALGPAGFGLTQMEASIVSGGLGMLINPKGGLMGGLMAGMGAYGGAGLGDALAKTGMEQATQAELAKNEAFKQAQQAAGQQASQLGQSYINAAQPSFMGPNMSPEILSENLQSITKPVTDIANNTATKVAVNSGYGGPDYVTSTMGNRLNTAFEGVKGLGTEGGRSSFMSNIGGGSGLAKTGLAAASPFILDAMKPKQPPPIKTDSSPGQQYTYSANPTTPTPLVDKYGREQTYFDHQYTPRYANGGLMANGGLSETHYNLGGYSDGGRLLRGPGDGVSDSIPATIGHKQPARLADGEFVVPARIVSELGNGSTEAGARKLYAMMDRVQSARSKTVGKGKIAANSKSEKYLPA